MAALICDFLQGWREGGWQQGAQEAERHFELPETQGELSACLEALSSETRALALKLYMQF